MNITRRHALQALIATAATPALHARAAAPAWPAKPIRIIMPYPAGGSSDVLMRQIGEKLTARWHQPIVIENRPGASGSIAAAATVQSAPDGYTFLWASSTLVTINPIAQANLPYDPKQLAAVTEVAKAEEFLIVNAQLPVRTLKEFVAYAKQHPKAVNYASFGNASTLYLSMKAFEAAAGIEMTHIPYGGVGPALTDLLANRVQAIYTSPITMRGPIAEGKLRVLAIGADERSAMLPDIPTFKQEGVDLTSATWLGLLAPAGTPKPIIDTMAEAVGGIVKMPDFQRTALIYYHPVGGRPEELARVIADEQIVIRERVKRLGIVFD